jgi:hypothetical protein
MAVITTNWSIYRTVAFSGSKSTYLTKHNGKPYTQGHVECMIQFSHSKNAFVTNFTDGYNWLDSVPKSFTSLKEAVKYADTRLA